MALSKNGTESVEGLGLRQPVAVSVADFRNLNKVAALSDDAEVSLKLGKEVTVSAYGKQYQVRQTSFRGKLPGTELSIPPVHFVAESEFLDMCDRAGVEEVAGAVVQAWYDKGVGERGAVEIPVPVGLQENSGLPESYPLTGRALKQLVALLHHEFAHSSGAEEFLAHRAQWEVEERLGLRDGDWNSLDILKHIKESYGEMDYMAACNEFADHADELGDSELLTKHLLELEAELENDSLSFPGLDELGIDPDSLDDEYF